MVFATAFLALGIAGCMRDDERAQALLSKVESQCGMETGQLRLEFTSDDPELDDRSAVNKVSVDVIYLAVSDLKPEIEACIEGVLNLEGYRLGRHKVD